VTPDDTPLDVAYDSVELCGFEVSSEGIVLAWAEGKVLSE